MKNKKQEPEENDWLDADDSFFFEAETDEPSHNFGDGVADDFIKIQNDQISTHEVAYENAKTLAQAIDMKKGECVAVNLTGRFIFGDFIGAFIQEHYLKVKHLTISSLAGNIQVYGLILALLERGWVDQIDMFLSEYTIAMDRKHSPDAVVFLIAATKKHPGKFNIFTGRIHSKIVLIETEKGGKVTMHGSANLRSSQSIEQLVIQENAQLYDFFFKYLQTLKN